MTVETASYISQLNNSYPAVGDPVGEGDDHLRLIKSVLKTSFPSSILLALVPLSIISIFVITPIVLIPF